MALIASLRPSLLLMGALRRRWYPPWARFLRRRAAVEAWLVREIRARRAAAEPQAALPYLDAVCQETLRLRPIAASIARVLNRPMTLGGYELPAGTAVSPTLLALHRRPELFPDPDAFRPERFVGRTFAPWELMPSGGGHRRCLGAAFAMFEMKIVLGTILQSRRLRLIGDVKMAVRNTVLGRARPLRFVASAAPAAS